MMMQRLFLSGLAAVICAALSASVAQAQGLDQPCKAKYLGYAVTMEKQWKNCERAPVKGDRLKAWQCWCRRG